MEKIIGGILFWSYILFLPYKFKKKITLIIFSVGALLIVTGIICLLTNNLPEYRSSFFGVGIGLVVLHFFTIFTSKGSWSESKGIEGYNQSKRLVLGECPYCNKKISRTAKKCPHCTTQLF
jgi:hypothetical protein